MNEYFIWINNHPIAVSEAVYKEYWRGRRKERYFAESDIHNRVFYYDALDTEEMNGSDIFYDKTQLSIDEMVLEHLEIDRLHKALKQLSDKDYELICRLYFYDESLRSVARKTDISLSTLHYRHKRILQRLKNMMHDFENT